MYTPLRRNPVTSDYNGGTDASGALEAFELHPWKKELTIPDIAKPPGGRNPDRRL